MRAVIGLTGRKRAGKSTAADAFTSLGYESVGFADELKSALLELDPIVTANGTRLSAMVERCGMECVKNEVPEVRRLLQVLGTDVVRKRSPNFWLNAFHQRTESINGLVVPDVRFDNEAQLIRSMGGLVIEVVRPSEPVDDDHSSEAGIRPDLVDCVAINDSTPETLRSIVLALVEHRSVAA